MSTTNVRKHMLPSDFPGTTREIVSLHFGSGQKGKKAYIQAGLHADEAPGYLVASRLGEMLWEADLRGEVLGEIIVVPIANPIGLAQWGTDTVQGRFNNSDNVNFNRRFDDLTGEIASEVGPLLTADSHKNVTLIRECAGKILNSRVLETEVDYLKNLLLRLSHDADIVLDLHCDYQALVHIYTGKSLWPYARDLSAQMGAGATILANDSGDTPFDEANSKFWWKLAEVFPNNPVPPACLAATVELRGVLETEHQYTEMDARNLYSFLQRRGFIDGEPPSLPPLKAEPTPLEGVDYVKAETAGVLSFVKEVGDYVNAGEVVAEVVDPVASFSGDSRNGRNEHSQVVCNSSGILFARSVDRFARPGKIVTKVAGTKTLFKKGSYMLTF